MVATIFRRLGLGPFEKQRPQNQVSAVVDPIAVGEIARVDDRLSCRDSRAQRDSPAAVWLDQDRAISTISLLSNNRARRLFPSAVAAQCAATG